MAGLGWALAFPLVGVRYGLQMYGDGALFSYAVAVEDAWAFHWHNISGRVFVYLATMLPAETYVGLTGDAAGGIALYGFLFFLAPLIGLAATFFADRSANRIFFHFACASTACLSPLVFGCPTEMWMAHAVFWPALAASHLERGGYSRWLLVFALMLALVLSHEGGVVLGAAIVASLAPRGARDPALRRALLAFGTAMLVWVAVKAVYRPDPYVADVLVSLAVRVFDVAVFTSDFVLLVAGALLFYGLSFHVLARIDRAKAPYLALLATVAVLAVYWLRFDHSLHTDNRYYLRTVLMVATPALGLLAAAFALRAAGRLSAMLPASGRLATLQAAIVPARAVSCVLAILTLIYAVETAKFVEAWTDYKAAVRGLAGAPQSDPKLGDARFVSAARLPAALEPLVWSSTTPYLSVLVTPDFAPARLVVDPDANFFWISCETATASLEAEGAIPARTRALVRTYSCLHRRTVAATKGGDGPAAP